MNVEPSLRSAEKNPGRFSTAADGRSATGSLTASEHQTEQKTDSGCDADRAPWVLVNIIVGIARSLTCALANDRIGLRQLHFGFVQTVLDPLSCDRNLLARLTGGCAQQFLRVRNNELHVLHELVSINRIVVHGIAIHVFLSPID